MSPSKFHQGSDVTKVMINGPRPSTLRTSRDSHPIHKPSSSPSSHRHLAGRQNGGVSSGKRPPVIIYTESPKIIHTNASEFMDLVQRLTGMSREEIDKKEKTMKSSTSEESIKNEGSMSAEDRDCGVVKSISSSNNNNNGGHDENDSLSSALTTDDKFVAHDLSTTMCKASDNNVSYFIDAPLFTPSSSDFLCSSLSRPNAMFQSPSMASSISPSFMDFNFVKGFPDY